MGRRCARSRAGGRRDADRAPSPPAGRSQRRHRTAEPGSAGLRPADALSSTMTVSPSAQHSRKMPRTYPPSVSSTSASTASAGSKSRFGTALSRPRLISPVSRRRNRKIRGMIIQLDRMWPSPAAPPGAPAVGGGLCRASADAVGSGSPCPVRRPRISSPCALARSYSSRRFDRPDAASAPRACDARNSARSSAVKARSSLTRSINGSRSRCASR